MQNKLIYSIIFALAFTLGCKTNPMTGRKHISLISTAALMPEVETAYRQALKEGKKCTDPVKVKMVNDVAKDLIDATERYYTKNKMAKEFKSFKWEVNVLEDATPNAFCMPGGKIMVLTGILPIAENKDGLAAILGHEIGHALAEHGNERISQVLLAQVGAVAVDLSTQNQSKELRTAVNLAYGIGAQLGVLLPFSRKHENEADEMGIYLAAMAGYDPSEAPKIWARMEKKFGSGPPAWLSTHPANAKRRAHLTSLIPKAKSMAIKYGKPGTKPVADPNAFAEVVPSGKPTGTTPGNALANTANYDGVYYRVQIALMPKYDPNHPDYKEAAQYGTLYSEFWSEKKQFHVMVGDFTDLAKASEIQMKLKSGKFKDAFIVKYKFGERLGKL